MRFYFPDSQDFIDPEFDFVSEEKSMLRVRQRDDLYAHQVFARKPYDGILVSKAIVEGIPGHSTRTRYSEGQKYRFYREGARKFFRLKRNFSVMGDSGAFTYAKEVLPPYTSDELIEFYVKSDVDMGVSLDHIIFEYFNNGNETTESNKQRREITLQNANDMFKARSNYRFTPFGVAQGWSIESYVDSVKQLEKMGFKHITIGGVVSLKTEQIVTLVKEILNRARPQTQFHLLGIGRAEIVKHFKGTNLVSVDCTTPLKKSFMNTDKNYQFKGEDYCAIRIPQSYGNRKIRAEVSAGRIGQSEVKKKESAALKLMRDFASKDIDIDIERVLKTVLDYEDLFSNKRNILEPKYRRTLEARPWERCKCEICSKIGIEVVIFRGSERNKRRGFHNLYDFYSELKLMR